VSSLRAGGHRVWANSEMTRRGATVSYAYTVRRRGRSVAVGRSAPRRRLDARDAAHGDARPRPRRERRRARTSTRERRPVGRSRIANRARVARIARETRATLGFHAPARRARIRRARIRRRVGEATRGAGEGSRGVVERSRAASASREAIARRAGPGDDGRARGRSCGCTFPRVVTRRIRDADPPGCGADSARIRGRWRRRCDGWSPCRSSAKRARARVKRRRAR
jgi:hypothetical protein